MREVKIENWVGENQSIILFAVQRLDELLFFYTQDTYKPNIYNTKTLFEEYLDVAKKINNGLLDKKNEGHIIEEILWSLKYDKEAKELIGLNLYEDFRKTVGGYSLNDKVKCIRYLKSFLSGKSYLDKIKDNLKNRMNTGEKKEVDRLLKQFVCEVKNCGYDNRYIYKMLKKYMVSAKTVSQSNFDAFLEHFSCESSQYTVYIVVNQELAEVGVNIVNAIRGIEIEIISDIPNGICVQRDEKVLRFKQVEALDEFTAIDSANELINIMGYFYSFYRHNIKVQIRSRYVEKEGEQLHIVKPEVRGIKKSAQIYSREESTNGANDLLKLSMTSLKNFYMLTRIMEIHSTAIELESSSNSLLDLWSILELILEKDLQKNDKSRITQIVGMLEPFIKNSYINQIMKTLNDDFKRWNKEEYKQILSTVTYGTSEIEKIFAFVTLDVYQKLREDVYDKLDQYPLLRYRIFNLNELFSNTKNIKNMISEHEKKTTWHIHRIYRARNCIIHDGEQIQHMDELVENLHYYIDVLGKGIVKLLNNHKDMYMIDDCLYEMNVKERLFMNFLQEEKINSDNFLYLLEH